jgi:hypothetical protein
MQCVGGAIGEQFSLFFLLCRQKKKRSKVWQFTAQKTLKVYKALFGL